MTGQDAVNIAKNFNERTGHRWRHSDQDGWGCKGRAALSDPIRDPETHQVSSGSERSSDALEVFHPDRMASRILGMGDFLPSSKRQRLPLMKLRLGRLEKKIRKDSFTLEDFRDQLHQIRKMGSLDSILQMIPGVPRR